MPQNRDLTEGRLLGFAMILALQCCPMFLGSALMRGIHPPEKIQNGGRSGGECLSYMHCLGTWQHESLCDSGYAFLAELAFCVVCIL